MYGLSFSIRLVGALCLSALLAACADIPELDNAVTEDARRAPSPEIVPLNPILASAAEVRLTSDDAEQLIGRAEALQVRAAELGG